MKHNVFETQLPSYLEAIEDCEDIFGCDNLNLDEELIEDDAAWALFDDLETLKKFDDFLAEIYEMEQEEEDLAKWECEQLMSVGL